MRARLVLALLVAVGVAAAASACGNDSDGCASGETRACLPDGTTCTCSPSCGGGSNPCAGYALCESGKCAACTGASCICSTGICVPHAWRSGESVSFERR